MSRRSSTIFSFISLVVIAFFGFRPAGETASAQSSPTAWTPELSMKVKAVGNVRVSPDGKRVLFTVNEPVMTADKSEYLITHLDGQCRRQRRLSDDVWREIIEQP